MWATNLRNTSVRLSSRKPERSPLICADDPENEVQNENVAAFPPVTKAV
jgi:hypothetical protein